MGQQQRRAVKVKDLIIGGGFPVSVQTMWKKPLQQNTCQSVVKSIEALSRMGCDLLRFAVPDVASAEILGTIAQSANVPIVADVHYDYRIALRCMDFPIAKIRINPGNIGALWKVEQVVRKAKDSGVAIRVGVNSGSLPPTLRREENVAAAMVKAAETELEVLLKLDFHEVVFSLKSPDPEATIEANTRFCEQADYPLHLGVTEAGPLVPGVVKNTYVLVTLLKQGIGDTIRVSLTGSSSDELLAGTQILKAIGEKRGGPEIVSCPKCGRASFDVEGFLQDVQNSIHSSNKDVTIAIMGCPVNGLGEARHADLGISGTESAVLIFRSGKVVRRVAVTDALAAFREEMEKL